MADEEKNEQQEQKPTAESAASGGSGMITWVAVAAVVIAGMLGGFALAQLTGNKAVGGPEDATAATNDNNITKTADEILEASGQGTDSWYYDMETVIDNLDEPGITRALRVTLCLKMSPDIDPEKGLLFLEENAIILSDHLSTYISGLTLERVRGSRNRSRIKNELKDKFNELLFPDSKPYIQDVLTKDFNVD